MTTTSVCTRPTTTNSLLLLLLLLFLLFFPLVFSYYYFFVTFSASCYVSFSSSNFWFIIIDYYQCCPFKFFFPFFVFLLCMKRWHIYTPNAQANWFCTPLCGINGVWIWTWPYHKIVAYYNAIVMHSNDIFNTLLNYFGLDFEDFFCWRAVEKPPKTPFRAINKEATRIFQVTFIHTFEIFSVFQTRSVCKWFFTSIASILLLSLLCWQSC